MNQNSFTTLQYICEKSASGTKMTFCAYISLLKNMSSKM